jgi:hypothetical protein
MRIMKFINIISRRQPVTLVTKIINTKITERKRMMASTEKVMLVEMATN